MVYRYRALAELPRQLEPDRDADEHPQPSLLGNQRAQLTQAIGGIFGRRGLDDRLVVRVAEPATVRQCRGQQPLQRRRRAQHQVLGVAEPGGIADRGDRRIELGFGVCAVGHSLSDHTYVTVPLTSLSHGAGCGCKLPAASIGRLLAALASTPDPNALVGFHTSDDAGVYRLRDDLALVHTVDFFTPIVDDPFDFGRIAAANALSDIYAMGATPVSALNLVAFSLEELGEQVLMEILQGGAHVATEAGVAILGGHSIEDREPKYGMAVTGVVHPDEVITNAGAKPGDALVLTKSLGAGAVSTAIKRGLDAPLEEAVSVMTTLNRDAASAARKANADAMTDVTGFGLLGHLREMLLASRVSAELDAEAVPAIDGVLELLGDADERAVAGGTRRNRAYAEEFTTFAPSVSPARRWLLCDAMTSGGLLTAVAAERAHEIPGAIIGRLSEGPSGTIAVG